MLYFKYNKCLEIGLMMKFCEFLLNEMKVSDGQYKDEIQLEDAVDIFKNHCKNIDVDEPFWRGMRDNYPCYIFEGQKSNRESTSDVKHHNLIIDDIIKHTGKDYPLRSKSIIAVGNKGKHIAKKFGKHVYAIFPYDDVVIGSVPYESDILDAMLRLDVYDNSDDYEITKSVYDVLGMLNNLGYGKSFDSVDDLCAEIFKHNDHIAFKKFFGDADSKDAVKKQLHKIFNLNNFDFNKTSSIKPHESEVWIGGKCLAIHESYLSIFKDLLK